MKKDREGEKEKEELESSQAINFYILKSLEA